MISGESDSVTANGEVDVDFELAPPVSPRTVRATTRRRSGNEAESRGVSSISDAGARLFHCSEGTAHKFWRVSVAGTEQVVHYGRIGTVGQVRVKRFESESAAQDATEKLIAEKTAKGYAEVAPEAAEEVLPRPVAGRSFPRLPWQQMTFAFEPDAPEDAGERRDEPVAPLAPAAPASGVLALDLFS